MENSLDKIFSCSLKLDALPFQVNGKALSEKYALAIANGEFMDDYRHGLPVLFLSSPKARVEYGFRACVDEKIF